MKLNNKGYTLVEVLGVIVILSILITIMVPSANYLIERNKENNYQNLKDSIIQSTKIYLADNRYKIKIEKTCTNNTEEINITSINGNTLIDSKILISTLIDNKALTTNSNNNIINPMNNTETLDLTNSYILVKYQCTNKDYTYTLEENSLIWH